MIPFGIASLLSATQSRCFTSGTVSIRPGLQLKMTHLPYWSFARKCASETHNSGEQMLHIGDNPVTDIVGGLEAGVQTLWFNQHSAKWVHENAEPHFEASTLSEISSLFDL